MSCFSANSWRFFSGVIGSSSRLIRARSSTGAAGSSGCMWPVLANHRRQADRQVEIGRFLLAHQPEQPVDERSVAAGVGLLDGHAWLVSRNSTICALLMMIVAPSVST